MTLRERWLAVPYGDKPHVRCRLVMEALTLRGGIAWARDIAEDLDANRKTVNDTLYHLSWLGRLMWMPNPCGPARLIPWPGMTKLIQETTTPRPPDESPPPFCFDQALCLRCGKRHADCQIPVELTPALVRAREPYLDPGPVIPPPLLICSECRDPLPAIIGPEALG